MDTNPNRSPSENGTPGKNHKRRNLLLGILAGIVLVAITFPLWNPQNLKINRLINDLNNSNPQVQSTASQTLVGIGGKSRRAASPLAE